MVINGIWLTSRWNVVGISFSCLKLQRYIIGNPEMVIAGEAALSIYNAMDNIWKITGYS